MGSPSCGSILITSAPSSPSTQAHMGPKSQVAISNHFESAEQGRVIR